MSVLACVRCCRSIDTDWCQVEDTDAPLCALCDVIVDPNDPPVIETVITLQLHET